MIRVFSVKVLLGALCFSVATSLYGHPHVSGRHLEDYILCHKSEISNKPEWQAGYPPEFYFDLPNGYAVAGIHIDASDDEGLRVTVNVRHRGHCFRVLYVFASDGSMDDCLVSCL